VEEEEKNKNMSLFDRTMEGRRIQLIHTDDEYTKLKSGDLGTVQYSFKNLNDIVVQVKWDSGIDLGLILGVDKFRILPTKTTTQQLQEEEEELLK